MKKKLFYLGILLLLSGCETSTSIVNNVDEREANEIVVYLASYGIAAQKVQGATSQTAGTTASIQYNIMVDKDKQLSALSVLNSSGLPRKQGTTLLQLFPAGGLMTTDKEETIRYQAGLEEELGNIIQKIDGILDADVQISFPPTSEIGTEQSKIKAAVYVKHQGVLDDPNQHLESKIKRLISGSIDGLNYDDVSVISDKSRYSDITLNSKSQLIGPKSLEKEYVSIWSIIMTKSSAKRFRTIFFMMTLIILGFGSALGWLIYKFYPFLQKTIKEKFPTKEK